MERGKAARGTDGRAWPRGEAFDAPGGNWGDGKAADPGALFLRYPFKA